MLERKAVSDRRAAKFAKLAGPQEEKIPLTKGL